MSEQDQHEHRRSKTAARIREARKAAGLSQGQVAKMLGLHRPSVSEIEAGNRRVSVDELLRMAEIFDVEMSWLMGTAPEIVSTDDPKVQLAARELLKMKPDDLDRLLRIIAAARRDDGPDREGGDRE
jgi:transcriptional regulator with XRE-family HTH domain